MLGRIFKRILKWVIVIVVIFALSCAALAYFFDANRLKPFIINRVHNLTGDELMINGPLSWSVYPMVGVKSGYIVLKSSPKSKQQYTVEAEHLLFSLRILPLLKGKVEAGTLAVNNGKVKLISAGNVVTLSNIFITAKDVNEAMFFPLKSSFDFVMTSPNVSGHVVAKGQTRVATNKQVQLSPLEIKSSVLAEKLHAEIKLSTNMLFDPAKQSIQLINIAGTVANIPIKGDIKLLKTDVNSFPVGTFDIGSFDLKEALASIGAKVDNLQLADVSAGKINILVDSGNLQLNGSLNMSSLRLAKMLFSDVSLPFSFENNIFTIDGGNAYFYEGRALLKFQASPIDNFVQYSTKASLRGVQMVSLLRDLSSKSKLNVTGVGDMSLRLATTGYDLNTLLSKLNGNAQFSVANGLVQGVDIEYLLDSALKIAGESVSPVWLGNTSFSILKGTAIIRNGIATNNDLKLVAKRFIVTGKGSLNLQTEKVNYLLKALINKTDADASDINNLYGLSLPIEISGSLSDLDVRIDRDVFLKALANQQLKKVKDKALRNIHNDIKDKAGDLLNNLFGN